MILYGQGWVIKKERYPGEKNGDNFSWRNIEFIGMGRRVALSIGQEMERFWRGA